MPAIPVQVVGIDLVTNLHDALVEHARQTPVTAPLTEVMLHRQSALDATGCLCTSDTACN